MAKASKSPFKKIYDLPQPTRVALDAMFADGVGVPQIVKNLQEGMGVFKDVKPASLVKYLYRYKWEVADKQFAMKVVKLQESKHGEAIISSAVESLNALEEVAQLVIVQKARVKKLLDQENKMPALFGTLGGELRTLSGFLQQFTNLSFDVGHMTKVASVTKVTAPNGNVTTVEQIGSRLATRAPEEQNELQLAASEFFNVLEGEFTNVSK